MLVVVHHGYVALGFEPCFYFKALGSLYVLKVDASEGGGYSLYNGDEFFGVFLIDLYVKAV